MARLVPDMTVRTSLAGPHAVVTVTGDLDMPSVPVLRAELDQVLSATRPPHLVIDLTETAFCDSVGLGLLVTTLNRVRDLGGRLVLAVAPGTVSRLLMITDLNHHFQVTGSREDALAALDAA